MKWNKKKQTEIKIFVKQQTDSRIRMMLANVDTTKAQKIYLAMNVSLVV